MYLHICTSEAKLLPGFFQLIGSKKSGRTFLKIYAVLLVFETFKHIDFQESHGTLSIAILNEI